MISKTKLNDYLFEVINDLNTPDEVIRFIKHLQIKMEFGHFEPDEDEEFYPHGEE